MKSGSSMNNYIYPKTMIYGILDVYVCGCRTKSNSFVWVKPGSFGLLLTDYTRLNFCSQQHLSSYQNTPKIQKKAFFWILLLLLQLHWIKWLTLFNVKKKEKGTGEKGEGESCMCARTHTHCRERHYYN
jgi:hypothetical protein